MTGTCAVWDRRGDRLVLRSKVMCTVRRARKIARALAHRIAYGTFRTKPIPRGCLFQARDLVQKVDVEFAVLQRGDKEEFLRLY